MGWREDDCNRRSQVTLYVRAFAGVPAKVGMKGKIAKRFWGGHGEDEVLRDVGDRRRRAQPSRQRVYACLPIGNFAGDEAEPDLCINLKVFAGHEVARILKLFYKKEIGGT